MPFKNQHPLYSTWQGIKRRCLNKNSHSYHRYGGRGIKICDAWINNFHQFITDMGEKPIGYSIDRIDNDGNYEPNNCRWANRKDQQKNRKIVNKIIIENIEYFAFEIAQQYGFKTDTIIRRAKTAKTFAELVDKKIKVYTAGLALGGKASGAKKQAMTHCKHGHEFTKENTSITKQGWRICKKCRCIKEQKRRDLLK